MRLKRWCGVGLFISFMTLTIFPYGIVHGQTSDCLTRTGTVAGYPACIEILRAGIPSIYLFNESLYRDRGVMIYGSPASIAEQENTFVPLEGGYYDWNGNSGEYRYHGFDVTGNKAENIWFPSQSGVDPGKLKTWVYRPWTNPNGVMNNALNKPNTPGEYATTMEVSSQTVSNGASKAYERLQTAMGWRPTLSYPTNSPNGALYNYAYVAQKASTHSPGIAYMWAYQSQTQKTWMQSLVIPQLVAGDKKMVPISVKLNVTSKDGESAPYSLLKSKDVNYKSLNVIVTATLGDQQYSTTPALQDEYLYRGDLVSSNQTWQIKLYDGAGVLVATNKSATIIEVNPTTLQSEAKAISQFKLSVPANQISANTLQLRAEAEAQFVTGEKANGSGTTMIPFQADTVPINYSLQSYVTRDYSKPITIDPKPNIPANAFDLVAFPISDSTNMENVASRIVTIDGIQVNPTTFFSSKYVFGNGTQGNHLVAITYKANDGTSVEFNKWVYVYDTKPRASFLISGANKVNRLSMMTENSATVNDSVVLEKFPITSYSYEFFSVDGDLGSLRKSLDTDESKKFLFKEKGTYGLRLKVTNTLGRTSDAYEVRFYIQDDFKPAIIQHPYSGQVARGESVSFSSMAGSSDGDTISQFTHEIYWDSNQDQLADTKVFSTSGQLKSFLPAKLGLYEVRSYAREDFGEETDLTFIRPTDYRKVEVTTYFSVDNYAPAAELFFDEATERPKADVYFMLDSQLNQSATDYLKNNMVTIRNQFSERRVDVELSKWDLKSYTYSTPMSTSKYTGSTYPESQISYSSDGYSGTLNLYLVNYTTGSYDNGGYQSITDSKTASDTCTNRVTVYYNASGYYSYTSSTSVCPSSKSYNDGNYTGTLVRTGENTSDPYCPSRLYPYATCSRTWTAYYSGTVSWTHVVWVSKWITTYSYTGYYTGMGYQTVREQKVDPFQSVGADRYLIYFSDSTITQLTEFTTVKEQFGSHVILVGSEAIQSQSNADFFVRAGPTTQQAISKIIDFIVGQVSDEQIKTVLVDEPFQIHTAEYDAEEDPIASRKMMVIHDYSTVDNALGAFPASVLTRTESAWLSESYPSSLSRPGTYKWIRKIHDAPLTSCTTCHYGYDSNEASLALFVHRRPIVSLAYTKTFNSTNGNYLMNWIDNSYDPDNQFRRADKGIKERQYRYKLISSNAWMNGLPNQLSPGTYILEAMVQDVNRAWSEGVTMNIQLNGDGTPVYALEGSVRHTKRWLAYHQQRGDETTTPPKSFFAGEKIVVEANVSDELLQHVQVKLELITVNGHSLSHEIELIKNHLNAMKYEGYLYRTDWASWKEPVLKGVYPVQFTATYTNGTSKIVEVPIRIIGSVYESYGVQRVK